MSVDVCGGEWSGKEAGGQRLDPAMPQHMAHKFEHPFFYGRDSFADHCREP